MGYLRIEEDKAFSKIRRIRLLLFDVDGVLTNGQLLYGPRDAEYKQFHVHDGLGLSLAQQAGLKTGIVTARRSQIVERRAKELNVDSFYQGYENKMPAFNQVLSQHGLKEEEICYMGDDLLDFALIRRAGFSAAPANARPEILARVDYVTSAKGGAGAVRELIEVILKTQEVWQSLLQTFAVS